MQGLLSKRQATAVDRYCLQTDRSGLLISDRTAKDGGCMRRRNRRRRTAASGSGLTGDGPFSSYRPQIGMRFAPIVRWDTENSYKGFWRADGRRKRRTTNRGRRRRSIVLRRAQTREKWHMSAWGCTSSLNTSSCSGAAQRRWGGGAERARRRRLKLVFGARGGAGACSAGEAGMQRWQRGLCRNEGSPRRAGPRLTRGAARDRGRVALRCDFWVRPEVGDDHRVPVVGGWREGARRGLLGPQFGPACWVAVCDCC
jgi:hypothetical protein